jgi:hypothetical protein
VNVWLRYTTKKGKCAYEGCKKAHELILGELQVRCRWYMRIKSGQKWMKEKSYHVDCWVAEARETLDRRVHVETRGRKTIPRTDEDRSERIKILRRRAAVVQRLKHETEMGGGNAPKKIQHLYDMLEQLKVEIMPYGGIPDGW